MLYMRKTFSFDYPLEEARVCLVGVPWDGTETGMPVRYGPVFLREAIKELPGFDPSSRANPFGSLKLADLGDVEVVPGSWELTSKAIGDTVKHILEVNPRAVPVFLGGEHLITLPIVGVMAGVHKDLTVVHLDAHRDLMPEWMGNPYSHITWAHHALKKGLNLVQIGARSWNQEEEGSIPRVKESLEGVEGPAYLTVDLDVLDPSHAPEVGTPEPGGMGPEELFRLVRKASGMELVGVDIVECGSQRVGTRTALMGANVFKHMLLGLGEKEGSEVHGKG